MSTASSTDVDKGDIVVSYKDVMIQIAIKMQQDALLQKCPNTT